MDIYPILVAASPYVRKLAHSVGNISVDMHASHRLDALWLMI